MSYHRTREPGPTGGSSSMTVCTNDVALGDLVENRLPVAVANALGDAEVLFVEVVELEHKRVPLAAIDAHMNLEVGDQLSRALSNYGPLAASSA